MSLSFGEIDVVRRKLSRSKRRPEPASPSQSLAGGHLDRHQDGFQANDGLAVQASAVHLRRDLQSVIHLVGYVNVVGMAFSNHNDIKMVPA